MTVKLRPRLSKLFKCQTANTATFPEDEYPTNKGEAAVMEHKWDPDAMRWIPKEHPPFSRPKPRQVNRHMLLRGLAEEIVYEEIRSPSSMPDGLLQ